jgi:hypothetical protein
MMKNNIFKITVVSVLVLALMSCEENNEASKPEILMEEFGYENSGVASPGSEFHIEAEILAEGKIDVVMIEIHPEDDHHHMKNNYSVNEGDEWEVDTTYTKFSGLRNAEFHEHLEIDSTAHEGHYHFHMIVNDLEGNQTTIEKELEIIREAR